MKKLKEFFTQQIPTSYLDRLKSFSIKIKIILYRCLSKSARISALYYAIFSSVFIKEQQGAMLGVYSYYNNLGVEQVTSYLLRRNIHRLEKGLLMRPRRSVFAASFISETLDCYERAVVSYKSHDDLGGKELVWAHDVLNEYFNVTDTNPVLNKAKVRFSRFPAVIDGSKCVPYIRGLSQTPPISYDDLLSLSQRRRSVRWYLQQPVPRSLLDKAMIVASLAPSACNRQPFEFRIFDEPSLVKQVSALPGGAIGFYKNIPVIVVIVGKLEAYFSEEDRHLIYIDSSLAVMAFMNALETLGLSSCGINWHAGGSKDEEISKLLGLLPQEQVIMLVAVGYPDPEGMIAYSQKKELELLRKYN